MKLSTRSRYAAQALFDIAFHSQGEATQVRQIAARQAIPARFLEQILQDLKRADLVDGKRGRNGGYFLRRPPEAITLGDVIRATDGPIEASFAAEEPVRPDVEARDIPAAVWNELAVRIAQVFDECTLADLVSRAEALGMARDEGYMYFI